MRHLLLAATALAAVATAPASAATTFSGTGGGLIIPLGANTQSSTISLADAGKVDSVTFSLNLLAHTAARDLTATVEHDGVTALLFSGVTGSRGLLGTYVFSDSAPNLLADGGGILRITPGTYRFSFPLGGSFVGSSIAGDWTLRVADNRFLGVGALASWSISGIGAVPEPSTWGMMILGFGAVGGAMRRRKARVVTTVRYA